MHKIKQLTPLPLSGHFLGVYVELMGLVDPGFARDWRLAQARREAAERWERWQSDTYLHNGYIRAELQEFKDKCEFELAYWEQQLAECLQAERSKQARRARAIDILLRRWCDKRDQAERNAEQLKLKSVSNEKAVERKTL